MAYLEIVELFIVLSSHISHNTLQISVGVRPLKSFDFDIQSLVQIRDIRRGHFPLLRD